MARLIHPLFRNSWNTSLRRPAAVRRRGVRHRLRPPHVARLLHRGFGSAELRLRVGREGSNSKTEHPLRPGAASTAVSQRRYGAARPLVVWNPAGRSVVLSRGPAKLDGESNHADCSSVHRCRRRSRSRTTVGVRHRPGLGERATGSHGLRLTLLRPRSSSGRACRALPHGSCRGRLIGRRVHEP